MFLTLDNIIIHPMLSPVLAGLFLLGWWNLGMRILARFIAVKRLKFTLRACLWFMLLGLLGAGMHLLAELHWCRLKPLRYVGWGIVGWGMLHARGYVTWNCREVWIWIVSFWRRGSVWQRFDLLVVLLVVLGYGLCAGAPPTDADSMDYHLGVPLMFLRDGGFSVAPSWFHSRFIGLGEYLNLAGLAIGTDCMGAMISFVAFIVVLRLVHEVADRQHEMLGMKLVTALPVLLFLLTSQKPQFVGCAAIIAGFMALLKTSRPQNHEILLVTFALFFAMSIKYSFYLTAGVAWCGLLYIGWRTKVIRSFVGWSVLAYVILVMPIHLGNFVHYGNPVTPIAEKIFTGDPGNMITDFQAGIAGFSEGYGFPLGLLLPRSPGIVSTVLGVGIFVLAFCLLHQRHVRLAGLTAIAMYIVICVLCQRTARFFVTPYLLGMMAAVSGNSLRRGVGVYGKLVTLQLIMIMGAVWMGVCTLAPGMLSWSLRDRVMQKACNNYSVAKWIDKQLPPDAVIFARSRSHALWPRPFVALGYSELAMCRPGEFAELVAHLPPHDLYLVTGGHPSGFMKLVVKKLVAESGSLPVGTRNPFNNLVKRVRIYEIDAQALKRKYGMEKAE